MIINKKYKKYKLVCTINMVRLRRPDYFQHGRQYLKHICILEGYAGIRKKTLHLISRHRIKQSNLFIISKILFEINIWIGPNGLSAKY
jgi:hypothetical protein